MQPLVLWLAPPISGAAPDAFHFCAFTCPAIMRRYCDRAIAAMMRSNKHCIVRILRSSVSSQHQSKPALRVISDDFVSIDVIRHAPSPSPSSPPLSILLMLNMASLLISNY